jgi:hypothetical protein
MCKKHEEKNALWRGKKLKFMFCYFNFTSFCKKKNVGIAQRRVENDVILCRGMIISYKFRDHHRTQYSCGCTYAEPNESTREWKQEDEKGEKNVQICLP